jgi:hypothetical protein
VACLEQEFGDCVCVVGSAHELGFWDPHFAVPLYTNEAIFPLWSANHEITTGQTVEYKYVIKKANGTLQWETSIENRRCAQLQTLGPKLNPQALY